MAKINVINDGGINVINELVAQLAKLQSDFNTLLTNFNTHTHTENTAASYTQNATTGTPGGSFTGLTSTASQTIVLYE